MNCKRLRKAWIVLLGIRLGLLATPAIAVPDEAKSGPVVVVTTYYPSMAATTVEKTLTNRIERWVNQAPGVHTIKSRSLAGVSIVQVYFRRDVNAGSALEITGKLALGTLPILPPNTLPPVVLPRSSRPVGVLVVHGASASEAELKDAARIEVHDWLGGIKGTVGTVVLGGKDREVIIRLDQKKLEARNLSLKDVAEALRRGKAMGTGFLGEKLILIAGKTLSGNELKALPIRSEGDRTVFLRDIGCIEDGYEPQTVLFRMDGRRAVGLPVCHRRNADPATVRDAVSKRMAGLAERMPQKVKIRWLPFGVEDKGNHADNGLLAIHVRAPSNSRLTETEKRVAAIERFLEKNIPAKERPAILSEVGMTPDWSAAHTDNAGPMDATLFVQLSPDRTLSAAAYASKLRRLMRYEVSFADLGVRFASHDMPAPVDIRIEGGKTEEAMRLAREVRQQLSTIKGTADVDIAQRMDAPYLLITADRRKAEAVGLTAREVVLQLAAVLHAPAPWIERRASGDAFAIIPFGSDPKIRLEDVLETKATGTKGEQSVKLSNLATLKRTTGAVEIDHYQLQRVFNVRANIEGRDRGDAIADIRKMLQELKVPEGIQVKLVD